MYITELSLYNFRNYKSLKENFSPEVNLITGKNAQGKTNLLEAVYFLSSTRSFRTSSNKEMILEREKEASVFADFIDDDEEFSLGVILGQGKKECFYNKEKTTIKDFLTRSSCVSFSPQDILIIQGSPGLRRRFFDKHVIDLFPEALDYYLNYNRALKNKTKVLKERADKEEVLVWNKVLIKNAEKITRHREKTLFEIEREANIHHTEYAKKDGKISLKIETERKGGFEDFFNQALEKELFLRKVLVGVQKDDISISLSNKPSRSFASQGQSRSLILSLKLAVVSLLEKQRKVSPIVLLDDVDSELDSLRREDFFNLIFSQKRQTFITGTGVFKEKIPKKVELSFYQLNEGVLSKK